MKIKVGDIGDYTFDASAKTITFSNMPRDMVLDDVLLITNVVDNIIIYRFDDPAFGGTISNNVLTLTYNTTSMDDADELQIYVEVPSWGECTMTKYDKTTYYHTDVHVNDLNISYEADIHSKVYSGGNGYDYDTVRVLKPADTDDGYLQVFRASADNVQLLVCCQSVSTAGSETQEFSCDYATDAEAASDWVPSDNYYFDVKRDTSPKYEGTSSLKFDFDGGTSQTATHTYSTAQDWSTKNAFKFAYRSEISGNNGNVRLIFIDSSNEEMWFDVEASSSNTWELKSLNFVAFNGYSGFDITNVKKIQWECLHSNEYNVYVDDIKLVSSSAASTPVLFELYDFGTTSDPTTLPSPMTLDEGGTQTERTIKTVRGPRNVHLHKGGHSHDPGDKLTIGNYYGIMIRKPLVGEVNLYGSASMQMYQSGKCYNVDGSTLTEDVSASLGFGITSTVNGVIRQIKIRGTDTMDGVYLYFMSMDVTTGKLDELKAVIEFVSDQIEYTLDWDYTRADEWLCDHQYNPACDVVPSLDMVADEVEFEVKYQYNEFTIYP